MIYTPRLDSASSKTLRNLAGAINEPMTKTIKEILKVMPLLMDSGKVCETCEDNSQCDECFFNQKNTEGFKSELFTDIIDKTNLQQDFFNSRFTQRKKPKKEKKVHLCKACEKKVKQHKKKQANKQPEESKEWKPEDGSFLEE